MLYSNYYDNIYYIALIYKEPLNDAYKNLSFTIKNYVNNNSSLGDIYGMILFIVLILIEVVLHICYYKSTKKEQDKI